MNRLFIALGCIALISCKATEAVNKTDGRSPEVAKDQPKTIEAFTNSMRRLEGFFPIYYDQAGGKLWAEVNKFDTEFLYVNSLPAGIGSNDIGLDRGQLGDTRIVKFVRSGPKVFLVQPNYDYRAVSNNEEERKSVEQAFAQSVIWGFEVAAESNSKVLLDLTPFLMRDAHGVAARLSQANQGKYQRDASRSALHMPMTKNFPENTEMEATVTFKGKASGEWIRSVVPTPDAVTVRMHHSFIQLPDSQYKPRKFDPRAGFNHISYQDYATPINQPLIKKFIRRHRLEKKNPEAAVSEAVAPIVYYLDRGAPEPVKSALMDGAAWWNQAFEAAGYKNAFQVKLLPAGADPMDVRYNLIQWIHRSTRGWSYGSSVTDPRTGEIIKGHVSLGSLRVRQDFLITEGLVGPYTSENATTVDLLEMSLARLRQLAAHEVGHTLGIIHNFAASYNNRASVMDYPHPYVKLANGKPDLSEAYDVNIGEWDKQVIKYGYSDFPENTDEEEALAKIIKENLDMGISLISDADARPRGGAHPIAHLWDNGTDPADELNRMMEIRKIVISNFSDNHIRQGAPMSKLEEVFVPMYLFHRYQIEAASKVLGGLNYSYALKGDGQVVTAMIDPKAQLKSLDALINTISAEALAVPEKLLQIIPPRAYGFPRTRETFKVRTGVTFDALGIAETASNMTVSLILNAQRASRLVEYKSRDSGQPGLTLVIDKLISATWKHAVSPGFYGEIQRVAAKVVLYNLIKLAANMKAAEQARAIAMLKLVELNEWIASTVKSQQDASQKAHLLYSQMQLNKFLENPEDAKINEPVSPPDGSPIGQDALYLEDYCTAN